MSDFRIRNDVRSELTQAIDSVVVLQPRVVWIFSDGIDARRTGSAHTAALIEALRTMSDDRAVRIHTTQFFYHDPSGVLKQIAVAHGGSYTFVTQPLGR